MKWIQPCNPSPCGLNAECTERGNAASCRCILDYIGNPYIECKPECTVNSECPRDKACVNNKCKDPCPGVCGVHASCRVGNHIPQCNCDPGYSGNAFVACTRVTTCKIIKVEIVFASSLYFFSITNNGENRSMQPITMRNQCSLSKQRKSCGLSMYPRLLRRPLCCLQA